MIKLEENKTIIGIYKLDKNNNWVPQKIDPIIIDYILINGYNLQEDYNNNNNNNDFIEIDFIEILIDSKNIEIKYYYGEGYILTYEEWDNKKQLINYIKNKQN